MEFVLLAGMAVVLVIIFILSFRALRIFPNESTVRVRYQDSYISGYSDKNWFTQGGSRRGLEVIVTDDELWIRPTFLLAFMGLIMDRVHKSPLTEIHQVYRSGDFVVTSFSDNKGRRRRFYLEPIDFEKYTKHVVRKSSPAE